MCSRKPPIARTAWAPPGARLIASRPGCRWQLAQQPLETRARPAPVDLQRLARDRHILLRPLEPHRQRHQVIRHPHQATDQSVLALADAVKCANSIVSPLARLEPASDRFGDARRTQTGRKNCGAGGSVRSKRVIGARALQARRSAQPGTPTFTLGSNSNHIGI